MDEQKVNINPTAKSWPKGSARKIDLESGRVLYLREPKYADMKQAARIATTESGLDGMSFLEEMVALIALELHDKNGNSVDISKKNNFFDSHFTWDEIQQMSQHQDTLGVSIPKKKPEVEINLLGAQ